MVLRKLVPQFIIVFQIIENEMMLKKCMNHESAVACGILKRSALCLTYNDVTELYHVWVLSFKRSGKTGYIPKFILLMFSAFQPGKYKINTSPW